MNKVTEALGELAILPRDSSLINLSDNRLIAIHRSILDQSLKLYSRIPMLEDTEEPREITLLNAFRLYYQKLEQSIREILLGTDLVVVARLGDDIDEFTVLFNQVGK